MERAIDLADPRGPELVALTEEGHDDELWGEFAEEQGLAWLDSLPESLTGWAWTPPVPVALDCELVLAVDMASMVDTEQIPEAARPSRAIEVGSPDAVDTLRVVATAILFYLRRDEDGEWLLAGYNEEPPDWPTSS